MDDKKAVMKDWSKCFLTDRNRKLFGMEEGGRLTEVGELSGLFPWKGEEAYQRWA